MSFKRGAGLCQKIESLPKTRLSVCRDDGGCNDDDDHDGFVTCFIAFTRKRMVIKWMMMIHPAANCVDADVEELLTVLNIAPPYRVQQLVVLTQMMVMRHQFQEKNVAFSLVNLKKGLFHNSSSASLMDNPVLDVRPNCLRNTTTIFSVLSS